MKNQVLVVKDELKNLKLEEVWKYFFTKLDII